MGTNPTTWHNQWTTPTWGTPAALSFHSGVLPGMHGVSQSCKYHYNSHSKRKRRGKRLQYIYWERYQQPRSTYNWEEWVYQTQIMTLTTLESWFFFLFGVVQWVKVFQCRANYSAKLHDALCKIKKKLRKWGKKIFIKMFIDVAKPFFLK